MARRKMNIFSRLAILNLLLIIIFSVWMLVPLKKVEPFELLSNKYFIFSKISIDNAGRVESILKEIVSELREDEGKLKTVRIITNKLLPINIFASLTYELDSKKPDYLILIKNDSLSKLGRMAKAGMTVHSLFKKKKQKVFLGFKGDIALVSNKRTLIDDALIKHSSRQHQANVVDIPATFENYQNFDISIYVMNENDKFTDFLQAMEARSSYNFFPSVKSIKKMDICVNVASAHHLEGKYFLFSKDLTMEDEQKNDMIFLFEALKRMLLAYDYGIEFTVGPFQARDLVTNFVIRKEGNI